MTMRDIPCPLEGGTYHIKNGRLAKGEPTPDHATAEGGKHSPAPAARSRKPSRED